MVLLRASLYALIEKGLPPFLECRASQTLARVAITWITCQNGFLDFVFHDLPLFSHYSSVGSKEGPENSYLKSPIDATDQKPML